VLLALTGLEGSQPFPGNEGAVPGQGDDEQQSELVLH
jgi:hypothetical protein